MHVMIEYIVEEPPEGANNRRCYKYPFMTAEVLSCEVDDVLNAFFDPWISDPDEEKKEIITSAIENIIEKAISNVEELKEEQENAKTILLEEAKIPGHRLPLLEHFLSLLKEPVVNPVLSGYFLKIIEVFMERKQLDFLSYIFGFKEHIDRLLHHIYDRHIADTIKKIISNEDRYFAGTTGNEFLYNKMLVIDHLIDQLDPANSAESIENSAYILCELIKGKQHLEYFNDEKVLKRVFAAVTSGSFPSSCAGIDYLNELLKLNPCETESKNTDHLYFIGYDNFEQIEDKTEEKLDYDNLMILASDCLKMLKDILLKKDEVLYETQFGAKIPPFGNERMKILEFLCRVMEVKNDIFCQRFQELEMPTVLLDLMEVYFMNTMLHTKICKVFSDAIKSNIPFLIDMV